MRDPVDVKRGAGLRARTSAAFAALALILSVSLALMTYGLTRRYLLSKRESLATQQAVLNARAVETSLADPALDRTAILASLANLDNSSSVMQLDGHWFATSSDTGRSVIPPDLQSSSTNRVERRRETIRGTPAVVVAVPIGSGGIYYEVFFLTELRATLRTLAGILLIAATVTTLLGALVGHLASRRLLRPIETMALTAASIAGGDNEKRLATSDGDLAPFIESFNNMVDALEERIEREARFATDVSHELRTPLTAIRAATEVLDRRVGDDARPALEILRRQTNRFEQLVLDLLEISRLHSGSADNALETVRPAELVGDALRRAGCSNVPVVVDASAPSEARLDRRRIERVLTNLIDNADHYAGGPSRIFIAGGCIAGGSNGGAANGGAPGMLEIAVDDAGPGVAPEERELVFERFHRGKASRSSPATGTGLGLAIAAEHCRLHGGRLSVTDSPDGGARFLIELPLGVTPASS